MNTEELAAKIYARVVSDRILGAPKVWVIEPKQAQKIAVACWSAAEIFMAESTKAQSGTPAA